VTSGHFVWRRPDFAVGLDAAEGRLIVTPRTVFGPFLVVSAVEDTFVWRRPIWRLCGRGSGRSCPSQPLLNATVTNRVESSYKTREGRRATLHTELLLAARTCSEPFGVFYERHSASVLAFFRRRVRGPEEAFDLAAETFAAALASVLRFPPGPKPPRA